MFQFFSDHLWAVVLIGGPIILAAVLVFARVRNQQDPRSDAHTEAATRELYREQAQQDGTGPGTES